MLNALTIDVEDYYHVSGFESVIRFEDWDRYESRVERNTHRMLDLLDAYSTKATFFVLGWVAERHPNLVRTIQERGHEVASHSYAHRLVYQMTPEEFRHDVRKAKTLVEDITGRPVTGFRAASFSITKRSLWGLETLVEEGFQYDSSIFPILRDRYGIPGYPRFPHRVELNGAYLLEYPPSTVTVGGARLPIAGGGYLRLFPYALIRWGIRQINEREKQPAIVYVHPWEIDPEQPRIRGSYLSRLRQYINLGKTEGVFTRLLEDFRFAPIRELARRSQGQDGMAGC
jgi:polysaccharide deacetylase family protein (PEP-CTERM system associated)